MIKLMVFESADTLIKTEQCVKSEFFGIMSFRISTLAVVVSTLSCN